MIKIVRSMKISTFQQLPTKLFFSFASSLPMKKGNSADVGSAYLNAPMPADSEVFMLLDSDVASSFVRLFPDSYKQFLRKDGSVVVKLDKAFYGCVQHQRLKAGSEAFFLLIARACLVLVESLSEKGK